MQIHSRELLFFIEVSSFPSFSDAANAMNIPSSTVSRRILELESRLDEKLFVRSKFGVGLTDFGKRFLEASRDVESSLNSLKALTRGVKQYQKTVIVEALHPIATLLITDFLPTFTQNYPDIVVDVRSVNQVDQTQNMGSNIRLQTHAFAHSKYRFIPFVKAERRFYLSSNLLVDWPGLGHPTDILKMGVPCVGIRNNITPPNIWSYSDRGKITDLVINPTLIVDDAAKARDAVLNNGGVSWNFDVLMSSALDRGEVVELFSSQFSTKEMGYICFEHSKHLSDSEKLFIDCLHQYYQVQSTTKEEHFDNALLV